MPRLRRLSSRKVCAVLSQHGFTKIRQRGSHINMRKTVVENGNPRDITVTVPDGREAIRIGTLSPIIRRSEIDRSEFE